MAFDFYTEDVPKDFDKKALLELMRRDERAVKLNEGFLFLLKLAKAGTDKRLMKANAASLDVDKEDVDFIMGLSEEEKDRLYNVLSEALKEYRELKRHDAASR